MDVIRGNQDETQRIMRFNLITGNRKFEPTIRRIIRVVWPWFLLRRFDVY